MNNFNLNEFKRYLAEFIWFFLSCIFLQCNQSLKYQPTYSLKKIEAVLFIISTKNIEDKLSRIDEIIRKDDRDGYFKD